MSYRCQEALIKAIDTTAEMPKTIEEAEAWASEWRLVEAGLHDVPNKAIAAQNEITPHEILSIVRTKMDREKAQERKDCQWNRTIKSSRRRPRAPIGVVSVTGGKHRSLIIPVTSAIEYRLHQFRSVDVFDSDAEKKFRLVFSKTEDRRLKLNGVADKTTIGVFCGSALNSMGIHKGRYMFTPLWDSPNCFEFEIDFSKEVSE